MPELHTGMQYVPVGDCLKTDRRLCLRNDWRWKDEHRFLQIMNNIMDGRSSPAYNKGSGIQMVYLSAVPCRNLLSSV